MTTREYRKAPTTIFVGGGPGGTGPLVCAAQEQRLDALLDRGLLLLDRGDSIGPGTIGRYLLNADSLGTSFLECLDRSATRSALGLDRIPDAASALEPHRQSHPPLKLVARHLAALGQGVQGVLQRHARADFVPHARVRRIVLHDASVQVDADVGLAERNATPVSYRCKNLVLALGGAQQRQHMLEASVAGLSLAEVSAAKVMLTDELLTPGGVQRAAKRLQASRNPRVVIVGASHSAFSAAWALLQGTPRIDWKAGAILLLHREEPRVFYPSADAARDDGYAFGDDDICPRTLRVHRLGGLRGDGRQLWREITSRPGTRREPRVELRPLDAVDDIGALLEQADWIVPAFGYRAATLPIFDPSGERIALAADRGDEHVDATCRVRRADGPPLRRVFGIGMAAGFRPSGSMGGESSFRGQTNGVWLYQNDIGRRVLDGIEQTA